MQPAAIRISGNTSFTAPGQTQQLIALGSYPDGERPIPDGVRWGSDDPSVASINATGTLTTIGLGLTQVTASYTQSSGRVLGAAATVAVTPLGTFAAGGRVREPGAGGLPGVLIEEIGTTMQTTSKNGGYFSIGGLTARALRLTRPGYEVTDVTSREGDMLDVPMQPILRLVPGGTVAALLAPNDVGYDLGSGLRCDRCRRVRLTSAAAGLITLDLQWSVPGLPFSIWIDGKEFPANPNLSPSVATSIPVQSGEQLIYVSGKNLSYSHVTWSLSASAIR